MDINFIDSAIFQGGNKLIGIIGSVIGASISGFVAIGLFRAQNKRQEKQRELEEENSLKERKNELENTFQYLSVSFQKIVISKIGTFEKMGDYITNYSNDKFGVFSHPIEIIQSEIESLLEFEKVNVLESFKLKTTDKYIIDFQDLVTYLAYYKEHSELNEKWIFDYKSELFELSKIIKVLAEELTNLMMDFNVKSRQKGFENLPDIHHTFFVINNQILNDYHANLRNDSGLKYHLDNLPEKIMAKYQSKFMEEPDIFPVFLKSKELRLRFKDYENKASEMCEALKTMNNGLEATNEKALRLIHKVFNPDFDEYNKETIK